MMSRSHMPVPKPKRICVQSLDYESTTCVVVLDMLPRDRTVLSVLCIVQWVEERKPGQQKLSEKNKDFKNYKNIIFPTYVHYIWLSLSFCEVKNTIIIIINSWFVQIITYSWVYLTLQLQLWYVMRDLHKVDILLALSVNGKGWEVLASPNCCKER